MLHSLISSKDRRQPRQINSSSRQQFPMHGDCTKPAIALMGIDPLPDSDLSTAAKDEPGDASHVYVKRQARSLSHAVETIFNYDPNGSLMSDGVFNYTYDAANRLNQ